MYTIYIIKPFNCASFRFGVGKSQAPHVGKGSRILMPLIQERYDTSVPVFDLRMLVSLNDIEAFLSEHVKKMAWIS